MTDSQPDSCEGSRKLCDGIDASQNPETILTTLQTIATHEDVSSVAIRCVELTQHDDEEIRNWAAECLSSSVRPGQDEESPLLDSLDTHLNTKSPSDSANDELYWLVTLIGRLPLDGPSSQERAQTLLARVASLDPSPAVDRAHRIRQRWT